MVNREAAVLCIARMNPPTKAHLMVLEKVVNTAKELGGDPIVFITHSQDQKKNPLPWDIKIQYIRDIVGDQVALCEDESVVTAMDFLVWVYSRGYKKIIWICGSDRVQDFNEFAQKYNGKDTSRGKYEFDDIKVVSAGERDPDAEDVTGFSATKARNAALDGDFETFKKIVAVNSPERASAMFNTIRKYMGLGESVLNTNLSINKRELTQFFKGLPESIVWEIIEGVDRIEEGLFDLTLKDRCEKCGYPLLWHAEKENGDIVHPDRERVLRNIRWIRRLKADKAKGEYSFSDSNIENSELDTWEAELLDSIIEGIASDAYEKGSDKTPLEGEQVDIVSTETAPPDEQEFDHYDYEFDKDDIALGRALYSSRGIPVTRRPYGELPRKVEAVEDSWLPLAKVIHNGIHLKAIPVERRIKLSNRIQLYILDSIGGGLRVTFKNGFKELLSFTMTRAAYEEGVKVLRVYAFEETTIDDIQQAYEELKLRVQEAREKKNYENDYSQALKDLDDPKPELIEAASRSVSTISFHFPPGLKGISDIHSQAQIAGVLTSFGRGVVGSNGEVRVGPVGSSHIGLSQGLKDARRFYWGYSREDETVYVVSKNGMDDDYIQNRKVLQIIVSAIFDKMKLSVGPKGLRIQETKKDKK